MHHRTENLFRQKATMNCDLPFRIRFERSRPRQISYVQLQLDYSFEASVIPLYVGNFHVLDPGHHVIIFDAALLNHHDDAMLRLYFNIVMPYAVCGLSICGAPGSRLCTCWTYGFTIDSQFLKACGMSSKHLEISPARTYEDTIAVVVPCHSMN